MYLSVNDTELYFDVEGAQLRVENNRLCTRPTIVVLHGGPGFDQAYLRPDLGGLADLAQLLFVDLRGQGRSRPVAVATCTLERMADDVVTLCAKLGLERPTLLGHSAGGFVALHAALRRPDAIGGLVLCNTTATLAGEPDPDAPTLLHRAGPEAAAVAARLFGGDMSAETTAAFERLVAPHYAAPGHEDVPARLFPLSPLNAEIARHFFAELAPAYDLRPRLRRDHGSHAGRVRRARLGVPAVGGTGARGRPAARDAVRPSRRRALHLRRAARALPCRARRIADQSLSCGVKDQAGGRGRNGTCSSRPLPTTSAVPAGISCQSPGSGASGSETTTRESAAKWANRSFSG